MPAPLPPPVIDSPPPRRYPWIIALLAIAAAAFVLFRFNPVEHAFYPRCWLYACAGIYCPGCGGLRAMHSLAHGHVLAALHDNPLAVLALPLMAWFGARLYFHEFAGKPLPPALFRPAWVKWMVAALVLFTVLRNIPVFPFTCLAPR